jgi:hypothetical protein
MQSSTQFPTPVKTSGLSNPEVLQSLTPIILATLGCLIGVAALLVPNLSNEKATAALGLAGTAFAGAAGLAKNESSFSAKKKGDDVEIDVPSAHRSE